MIKHRRGGTRPIHQLAVGLSSSKPTLDIAIGDMLAMQAGAPVPAASFTWDTDEATTRVEFVAAFLGISMDRSRLGTSDVRDLTVDVDTDGVYDVELASATTLVVGDLLGPAKAAGNTLLSQKCKKVTAENEAIYVVVQAGTSLTTARAQLRNSVIDRVSI